MNRRSPVLWALKILSLILCVMASGTAAGLAVETPRLNAHDNVFLQFTGHIADQVQIDKEQFAAAEVCTRWFYQQLKPKSPRGTPAQPISNALTAVPESHECQSRYPKGIDGARDEWSRTQSSLSLSLTFYEFALVGDRNDDGQYSDAELRDILEAFGLAVETPLTDPITVATLNNKFDAVRKFGGLEVLLASMEALQGKGYRFTLQDREALGRIMG
jgi:hypothetical protein